MGDDFRNRMIFLGDEDLDKHRASVIEVTRAFLATTGMRRVEDEDGSDRSVTFGPQARWLFMGDTAGSTECASLEQWRALSAVISEAFPIAEVIMSDSCCVHIELWRAGELVDRIGTGEMPWGQIKEDTAEKLGGTIEHWRPFLVPEQGDEALAEGWHMNQQPFELIRRAITLFGWHPSLCCTGYSLDLDGIFCKYEPEEHDLTAAHFTELHWDASNLSNASL